MTLPRVVIPGSCLLITRRCLERMMLLRPDEAVVALFAELLEAASRRCGVAVLGVVLMSNHYHLVLQDREGRFPEFIGWFHARLTRRLNRLRRRTDTMWEARQTSVVELGDGDAVLEALAYLHLNPVAAGLVEDPLTWPGVVTGPADYAPGGAASGRRWPFEVEVPPTHRHLSAGAFARQLSERIEERLRWLHDANRQLGRTYGSPEAALAVPWYMTPDGPRFQGSSDEGADGPGNPSRGSEQGDADVLSEAFRRRIMESTVDPDLCCAPLRSPITGHHLEEGHQAAPETGIPSQTPSQGSVIPGSVIPGTDSPSQAPSLGSFLRSPHTLQTPSQGSFLRHQLHPSIHPSEGSAHPGSADPTLFHPALSLGSDRGSTRPPFASSRFVSTPSDGSCDPGPLSRRPTPASPPPRRHATRPRVTRPKVRTETTRPRERPAINPTVKASSPERRAGLLERLRGFRNAYAAALVALRNGLDVAFPGGTWSLRRNLHVRTEPAPPPAWRLP